MKNTFYTLSAIFTIIALILTFENIMVTFTGFIFFSSMNTSVFYPLMMLFAIGLIAGFFLALAISAKNSPAGEGDNF